MYAPELLDHFQNPRHAGTLPPPARTVRVENPVCGDILELGIDWEAGIARQVAFRTRGCTASIAAGSALAEWATGRTRAELAAFTTAVIEEALGGLPNESKHAAVLCREALQAALAGLPPQ